MRILIVSDTHKFLGNLEAAVKQAGKIDLMLHLGDAEMKQELIEELVTCPVEIVAGNNDYFYDYPREMELYIEGNKFYLTHGHYHRVSLTKEYLIDEAHDRQAQIVLFGHTHRPYVKKKEGIWVINPGSLSYPRQEGRRPSYAIMEVSADKEPETTIFYL